MGVNWLTNRYGERYEYVKVSWDDWQEGENYDYITSGNIEFSSTSELKVTGTFEFLGLQVPNTSDLIRVYYSFYDGKDNYVRIPLSTFFVSFSARSLNALANGVASSGSLNASSLLLALQKPVSGVPYTIKKNDNAIHKAQEIVKSFGLNVSYVPDSTIIMADHTFSAGTNYLEIVNWLCDQASYRQVYTDEYGTVIFRPKTDIDLVDSKWHFANDDQSIMYPEVSQENNWQEVPNVIRLLYNTDAACAIAEARNVKGSRTSLEANGNREITKFEEVGDVGKGKILTNLINKAEEELREVSCDTEYVTFSHAWVPIGLFDVVSINYSNINWIGYVDTMSIDLRSSTKTQTKIRRDLKSKITVEKDGKIIRNLKVD